MKPDSPALRICGTSRISERHRHRVEVNNAYREGLEDGGPVLSGVSPDGCLVEVVELPAHAHFIGCEFHHDFKSKPHTPHCLCTSFVRAAIANHVRRAKSVGNATEALVN